MPPKKKGNGEDEAEACPADMDPEVWAVVKDVNQLVALASKKTSAPPVTRFDALLHLWSAAASNPRERDALVAAGALNASLAASKPDVPEGLLVERKTQVAEGNLDPTLGKLI